MIPMAGDQFGPYEILGTLGRGGVGEVYRAWDRRLEREVALKLLHDEYPQPGNRERFMIEARAASALNHANICTIFDVGSKDGWPYLVMELLKGITLKQRIERSSMSAGEIVRVATEMAGALGAAHALGIIHRDVKPANVMLTKQADGRTRVKVLDFGLAKLTGPLPGQLNHREEHLTVVGEAVGTVSYMSPEQARGDELDGRSDLFSLGVVMYEMATRRTPFHGSTTALLFAQLLGKDPEPIREWNDSIPRNLEKVIFRLLEKEPARRFREAQEVVEALENVASKLGGSRWRRAATPAVPLVRVEEPVARAELPARPEFLREQPKMPPVSSAAWSLKQPASELRPVSGDTSSGLRGQLNSEESGPRRQSASADAIIQPQSFETTPVRESTEVPGQKDHATVIDPEPMAPIRDFVASSMSTAARTPSLEGLPLTSEAVASDSGVASRNLARLPETPVLPLEQSVTASEVTRPVETGPVQPAGAVHPEWAGGHFLRVADAADYEAYLENGAKTREWRSRMWIGAGVAAAVLCLAGAAFKVRAAGNHGVALALSDGVMVTAIENHTGVQTLDGSIAEGLEFQLAQSELVTVRGVDEFRTTVHAMGSDGETVSRALARRAAQAAGARAFVYGEIREGEQGAHGTGAGFVLHVGVFDVVAGKELASTEAKAERTQAIAAAIDEVAQQLAGSVAGTSAARGNRALKQVPLAREATGNLNALHSYAAGVEARAQGRRMAALRLFATSAATDRNFVQAQLESAWLGHEAGAEVASAQAAMRALEASEGRSSRIIALATVAGELIGRGQPERAVSAAKTLLQQNPQDVPARLAVVRVLCASGQFAEAAKVGQEGLTAGVREGDLYRQTALALIGLDRYDAALALEERSGAQAVAHPEIVLEASYLAGNEERVATALSSFAKNTDDTFLFSSARAVYLDDIGRLGEGQVEWTNAARLARVQPGLGGAGERLLSKAALNRAFAGECAAAAQLAHVVTSRSAAGSEARTDAALAGALCGDSEIGVRTDDPRVRAASSLVQGEPEAAAKALTETVQSGTDPVTTLLQGMAHLQAGGSKAAIQEFRTILQHRGSTYGTGLDLLAMAELKLARAYTEAGERSHSMDAYRQFLRTWDGAGSGDRLRVEAVNGARGALTFGPPETPRVLMAATGGSGAGSAGRPVQARRKDSSPFPTPSWLIPADAGQGTASSATALPSEPPAVQGAPGANPE